MGDRPQEVEQEEEDRVHTHDDEEDEEEEEEEEEEDQLIEDRKSTRLNSSHSGESRMPSSA